MKLIKTLCLILTFTPIFIEFDNISRTNTTPLHQAVRDGKFEQVHKLISSGIYVDALNMVGNTPLHLAAQNGYNEQGTIPDVETTTPRQIKYPN